MYLIDREKNRVTKLKRKSFSELKFREREHLQEWIANDPSTLGEELLIIQKEFNGFSETNERLDLLALDKRGNLVIIENKLDDSGKDVTWQALKYASYCASLTKQDILNIYQDYLGFSAIAQEMISEFFDNRDISEIVLNQGLNSQRLILIAANFRKEVTSTVLWLMNFKIRLQCFKVTPFAFGDQLFLNVEQILPTKDTEDFVISIATKAQEEIEVQDSLKNRHFVRLKFWEQFITASNQVNQLFSNNSPTKENWIGKGIGMSGVNINLAISNNYCRSEVIFNRGSQEENKELFDFIYELKDKIESDFGGKLTWERMDDKITCRIKAQLDGVSYFEESDWKKMNEFLIDVSVRMERAFKEPIRKLNNFWKNK
jgi:hypothetical protein